MEFLDGLMPRDHPGINPGTTDQAAKYAHPGALVPEGWPDYGDLASIPPTGRPTMDTRGGSQRTADDPDRFPAPRPFWDELQANGQ
jgi:hypothetical protein